MNEPPPPYDGAAYQPTRALSDAERTWGKSLYKPQHAILGWRLVGRDTEGHLVAAATVACGRDQTHVRHCYLTFTPDGLVHRSARVPRP